MHLIVGLKRVFRGYEALSCVAAEANLQSPEKITSVYLRKYMATVAQVWNLTFTPHHL